MTILFLIMNQVSFKVKNVITRCYQKIVCGLVFVGMTCCCSKLWAMLGKTLRQKFSGPNIIITPHTLFVVSMYIITDNTLKETWDMYLQDVLQLEIQGSAKLCKVRDL